MHETHIKLPAFTTSSEQHAPWKHENYFPNHSTLFPTGDDRIPLTALSHVITGTLLLVMTVAKNFTTYDNDNIAIVCCYVFVVVAAAAVVIVLVFFFVTDISIPTCAILITSTLLTRT